MLRGVDAGLVTADRDHVEIAVDADVCTLLDALDDGDIGTAFDLHRGPFLTGVPMRHVGEELEDWIFDTREHIADRLRRALLDHAEPLAAIEPDRARSLAERADELGRVIDADPDTALRIHTTLLATRSPRAVSARAGALALGLDLAPTQADALARLGAASDDALPHPPTSFVGRTAELAELFEILDGPDRLVTIGGLAGAGKSRLALELAHRARPTRRFADGVHFVELADVTTLDDAAGALAETLGVRAGRVGILEAVADHLADRRCLVVLDDAAEVDDLGQLVGQLLRGSGVRIVATSRTPLGIHGEVLVTLGGLSLRPTPGGSSQESEAAQLFEQRARRRHLGFRVADHRTDVERLCELTDGSPLALELAAGWIGTLPVGEIVAELRRDLDLLQKMECDQDDRHQSLRHVFEQAWTKLSPLERRTMRRVAVFRGGFRRDAANDIADATLQVLSSLTRASLLRLAPTGRYHMHPLVQVFARRELDDDPDEAAAIVESHASWYRAAAARWVVGAFGSEHRQLFVRIGEEMPNVLAAWDHAVESVDDRTVIELARILVYFRYIGRPRAAVRRWEHARTQYESRRGDCHVVIGELLAHESRGRLQLHEPEVAFTLAERAVTMLRPLPEAQFALREALVALAELAGDRGDLEAARRHRRELDDLGIAEHPAITHRGRGAGHLRAGRFADAVDEFTEALRVSRERGDRGSELAALAERGSAYLHLAQSDAAERDLQRVRALADRRVHVFEEIACLGLGRVALLRRDAVAAMSFGEHLRRYAADDGDASFVPAGDALLAGAALLESDVDRAVDHARRANADGGPDNVMVRWFTYSVIAEVLRANNRNAELARLAAYARTNATGWPGELAKIEDAAAHLEATHDAVTDELAAGGGRQRPVLLSR